MTECSKTCGGGVQTFTRQKVQEAEHGGEACHGEAFEDVTCNNNTCPGNVSEFVMKLVRANIFYLNIDV